jgi:hypothetical protein
MGVHIYNPSYSGGRGRRISNPDKLVETYLKNKIKTKGLGL